MVAKLFQKIYTILGWTLLGGASAYIVVSVVVFSQVMVKLIFIGTIPSPWIQNALLYGLACGFFVGLVKTCAVDMLSRWQREETKKVGF